MPIVALDVHYLAEQARTGWVLFHEWSDGQAHQEGTVLYPRVADYEPGAFYKRELPCLWAAVQALARPDMLVVDGFCWLGQGQPGLGWHLHQALEGRCPVIGVAKTAYHGRPGTPVRRGRSQTPLYVTACGVEEDWAARQIENMHGPFRVPSLLRRADQLARGL
ncbi:MAG: endonuclease V [Vulcanimicrobiota bacterium]